MIRYSINLATKPFRNNAIVWIVLAISVVALSAFTWYSVDRYRIISEDLDIWTARLAERQNALQGLVSDIVTMNSEVGKLDLVSFNQRSGFANSIIVSRLFSWSLLFERLEEVLPYQVRLRSVRPAVGRRGIEVSLDGASKDHESLLEFEERLIESPWFTLVYPLMENSRKKAGEIQFNIAFAYLPGGPVPEPAPVPGQEEVAEGAGEAAAEADGLSLDEILEEEPAAGEPVDPNEDEVADPNAGESDPNGEEGDRAEGGR